MSKSEGPKLPSFEKKPSGMLSKLEAEMSDKAKDDADQAPAIDPQGGVIPAQHCSHGSHGSW